ncbi:MAG: hypothetical protein GTN80_06530 [Nitrososphaeria archaeon]|nr:hypothetical protein [Nitrososphaeria archaeon]NIQ33283.1 hypothetical protein [Nitrososphaeria archaeon]
MNSSIDLVEEAEDQHHSVEADASEGFHNPKLYTEKLTEATVMAQNAVDLAEASRILGEKIADIDKAVKAATAGLEAELSKSQADLKTAETKLAETHDKLAALENTLEKTEADLAKSEADQKEAVKKLSDAEAALATLQTKV